MAEIKITIPDNKVGECIKALCKGKTPVAALAKQDIINYIKGLVKEERKNTINIDDLNLT